MNRLVKGNIVVLDSGNIAQIIDSGFDFHFKERAYKTRILYEVNKKDIFSTFFYSDYANRLVRKATEREIKAARILFGETVSIKNS